MGASDDHNRAFSLPPLVRRRGGVAMADREEDPSPSLAPLVTGGFHPPSENSTPQDRMKPLVSFRWVSVPAPVRTTRPSE